MTLASSVHVEPVMGTVVSFHVFGPGRDAGGAVAAACHRLHELDGIFSTWDPSSPMSRLRRGALALGQAPPEIAEVLTICRKAREASGGWFDPWAMPGGLDPTGLVKGWAVEGTLEPLRQAGVQAAMVNGGGDIALLGPPPQGGPWRVGIRHPWRHDGLACVLEVAAGGVATSGTYERGPHLVDPHLGTPALAAASATVTGPSLAMADALATALAVGGLPVLELLEGLAGYEGYLVGTDGSEATTAGIAFG